jgi:biopolymer transport protein ExbB/TolQ
MDTVDIVAVTLGVAFIAYMVYKAMDERNEALKVKINAEIDKLSR